MTKAHEHHMQGWFNPDKSNATRVLVNMSMQKDRYYKPNELRADGRQVYAQAHVHVHVHACVCVCVCTGALALHEAVGAGRVHPDRVLKNTSSSQP